ncbi:MAG TPA: iron-sulfur cluster assembly accessory protein, partial [Myxococcaceae bacterium]|nr:iron-sulfur cluster assembly accessory protein [Myxococcaceae bacterium]
MTAPAQNAAPAAAPAPAPARPAGKTFGIADGAAARIKALLAQRNTPEAGLRVAVRGGGCSGLSYAIEWAEAPKERDKIFEKDGVRV